MLMLSKSNRKLRSKLLHNQIELVKMKMETEALKYEKLKEIDFNKVEK